MPNIYDMADTWNNAATVFTAIKMNVTDTASNASSLLMDLQVGGSSRFRVDKTGNVILQAGTSSIYSSAPGRPKLRFTSSNTIGTEDGAFVIANGVLGFSSSFASGFDLALYRDAANALAQRNGVNPQAFNVYNTYTDASNYERATMRWASNVLEIGTEAAGTGISRKINLKTHSGSGVRTGLIDADDVEIYNPSFNVVFDQSAGCVTPNIPIDIGRSTLPWRDLFLRPSSSLTPNANGDLCIEATNNTTLTFKYKGSDGTVRSGTVALS